MSTGVVSLEYLYIHKRNANAIFLRSLSGFCIRRQQQRAHSFNAKHIVVSAITRLGFVRQTGQTEKCDQNVHTHTHTPPIGFYFRSSCVFLVHVSKCIRNAAAAAYVLCQCSQPSLDGAHKSRLMRASRQPACAMPPFTIKPFQQRKIWQSHSREQHSDSSDCDVRCCNHSVDLLRCERRPQQDVFAPCSPRNKVFTEQYQFFSQTAAKDTSERCAKSDASDRHIRRRKPSLWIGIPAIGPTTAWAIKDSTIWWLSTTPRLVWNIRTLGVAVAPSRR